MGIVSVYLPIGFVRATSEVDETDPHFLFCVFRQGRTEANHIFMKKIILIAAAVIAVSSCGSTTMVTRTAKSGELSYLTMATTITSELKVSETKVTGEANNPNSFFGQGELEKTAVADALKKVDADILLEPQYEYKRVDGKLVSVKVSGYPARYTNFRPITSEDVDIYNKLKAPRQETLVIIKEKETEKK